jgi:histidyl-tRNA synthetase
LFLIQFNSADLYEYIVSGGRKILENYGYKRILVNTVERKEVFSRSLGIASDIV